MIVKVYFLLLTIFNDEKKFIIICYYSFHIKSINDNNIFIITKFLFKNF